VFIARPPVDRPGAPALAPSQTSCVHGRRLVGTGDRGVYERHHVVKMTTRRSMAFALGKSSEHAGLACMRPEVLAVAARRFASLPSAVAVSLHPARGSQAQGCKRYAVGSIAVVWPAPITASLYGAHVRGRSAFGGRRR
jgi:hypothetical protein